MISLLDGSRDRAQVISAAGDRGIPPQTAERVLTLLAAGGALEDFPAGTYRALPRQLRARLAPELAAASLAHGDGDGGARVLARRRAAYVSVHGGGRLGSGVAGLLTASGIGQVTSSGDSGPEAGGEPLAGARPDLVVLIGTHVPELAASLMRGQIPHLAAAAGEAIGVVGPLVVPGTSACLRCLDLARTDRDPAWPLILAQLAGPDAPGTGKPVLEVRVQTPGPPPGR